MIHFDKKLCAQAKQIIKAKDYVDMANDLADIDNQLNVLQIFPTPEAIIISAKDLDKKLHSKYPIIDVLLKVGNTVSNTFNLLPQQYLSINDELKSYLTQDYFGILCHSLIKGKTINSVEKFIEHVD